MPLAFVYGPDALQGKMFDRVGPSEFIGPAAVEGYELVFDKPNMKVKEEGLHNLRSAEGKRAFGLVFELSRKQLEELSGFYGGYEMKSVKVHVRRGDTETIEEASVFIARRVKAGLKPSSLSLASTRKSMEENGADPGFLESLKNFSTL